jgi:hypothetical protein
VKVSNDFEAFAVTFEPTLPVWIIALASPADRTFSRFFIFRREATLPRSSVLLAYALCHSRFRFPFRLASCVILVLRKRLALGKKKIFGRSKKMLKPLCHKAKKNFDIVFPYFLTRFFRKPLCHKVLLVFSALCSFSCF